MCHRSHPILAPWVIIYTYTYIKSMLLLKVVQQAVGNQIKELYTLESIYSVLDEDFLIEPNVFSGIYWVGSKARIFVVKDGSFESYPLNA